MMKVEKKQAKVWAKRMHNSFKCYKENLITLFTIEKRLEKLRIDKQNEKSESLLNLDWNQNENQESKTTDLNENLLDENSIETIARIKSNFNSSYF
jgi:hypothetical protein